MNKYGKVRLFSLQLELLAFVLRVCVDVGVKALLRSDKEDHEINLLGILSEMGLLNLWKDLKSRIHIGIDHLWKSRNGLPVIFILSPASNA